MLIFMLKKIREIFIFKKKIRPIIQLGIYQGPTQAFTALCSTKIVAATAI